MNRRKLLATLGTGGLTSFAGCQTFSGLVRTGPPHFEEVEMTGPDEVMVGEEFHLEVSAKNTGGEKGDFTNTLTVGEGAFSAEKNIKIEDIGVTQSRTTEVGPYRIGYTGDYKFRITDYGASQSVSVTTRTFDSNEEIDIEDGPTISVTDTTLRQSVAYQTADGREVLTPGSGRILAFIHLSVENDGDSKLYTGPSSFTVENGERIDGIDRYGVSLSDLQDIKGQPLSSDTVLPYESKSGWILAEVSRETANDGINLSWNRDSESSEPEARWTLTETELPEYTVTQMNFPTEVEIGTTTEGTITVKNTGSAPGTFHGILERRNSGETEWHRLNTFSLELDAGSSKKWSTRIKEPHLGASQYRLRPTSVTRTIDFVPATRSLEQTYTTPEGAKILVNIGGFNFDGLHSSYTYESVWDDETVTASTGSTFAFVKISVENVSGESIDFPSRSAFKVMADGELYAPEDSLTYGTMELVSPVDGVEYSTGWQYTSGETDAGWLIFEVPSNISKNELTVQYSPSKEITATWSTE